MRNNTAGILAFAGATLFTLSGIFLVPQFQKVSVAHYLASPNGTQAIIPQLMLLHYPQRIYLHGITYIISTDTEWTRLGMIQ